jgi:DNA-binding transcriptional LysR family regulator
MPMVFTGTTAHKRRWTLAELCAAHELLTFQRGSQPHAALLDLCRRQAVEPPRVHTISSISAMVQLVENGFGVATLPQAAVARLAPQRGLRLLTLDVAMTPLPIHLSWRDDPATPAAAAVLDSVLRFNAPAAGQSKASSKKSMSP